MASLREEAERLKFLVGKGRGDEKIHVVFVEEEAKARVENLGDKPKTRFCMETDSAEAYSDLNREKDRWIRAIGNKSVCISLMIQAWQQYDDAQLRRAAEGMEAIGAERQEGQLGRAEIPEEF